MSVYNYSVRHLEESHPPLAFGAFLGGDINPSTWKNIEQQGLAGLTSFQLVDTPLEQESCIYTISTELYMHSVKGDERIYGRAFPTRPLTFDDTCPQSDLHIIFSLSIIGLKLKNKYSYNIYIYI